MTMILEWKVECGASAEWIVARDGDDACERYRVRHRLPIYMLDEMTVADVRPRGEREVPR